MLIECHKLLSGKTNVVYNEDHKVMFVLIELNTCYIILATTFS